MQAQISPASSPSIRSSLSFNSPAALFVKVIARIRQGATGSSAASSFASSPPCRSFCSISSSAPSGRRSLSEAQPYFSRLAIRLIKTVVFPLPAPARISSGPSVARTASLCLLFSFSKSERTMFLRASTNLFVKSSMSAILTQSPVFHKHKKNAGIKSPTFPLLFFQQLTQRVNRTALQPGNLHLRYMEHTGAVLLGHAMIKAQGDHLPFAIW